VTLRAPYVLKYAQVIKMQRYRPQNDLPATLNGKT